MAFRTTALILFILFSVNMVPRLSESAKLVKELPGFPGKLPFTLETGYIGVGENEEVQLFYYFIKSDNNPEEDPLMLWLTGGPGCTDLWAIIYEMGPMTIDYTNTSGSIPALTSKEYSWTKVASIIFLDQPVGTGFSYATTGEAYFTSDTMSATQTYEFLKKWLINHPKYLKNPLYIGGDSFSGIPLPLVVEKVYNGIKLGMEPVMNFKGYILGNAVTDKHNDFNEKIPYAHRMGLLSDKLYQSVKEACQGNYLNVDSENVLCHNALERVNQCLNKVRANHILEAWCGSSENQDMISENFLQLVTTLTKPWCRDDNYLFLSTWARDKSVQQALYVREGTISEWKRCNSTLKTSTYMYDIQSTTGYHQNFTRERGRVLVYSGDHDMLIPHTSTEKWIDSLNMPIQNDWRPWFVEGQIAGYTITYSQGDFELTYVTVKGSGHTVPEYNPIEGFAMIRNWFAEIDL